MLLLRLRTSRHLPGLTGRLRRSCLDPCMSLKVRHAWWPLGGNVKILTRLLTDREFVIGYVYPTKFAKSRWPILSRHSLTLSRSGYEPQKTHGIFSEMCAAAWTLSMVSETYRIRVFAHGVKLRAWWRVFTPEERAAKKRFGQGKGGGKGRQGGYEPQEGHQPQAYVPVADRTPSTHWNWATQPQGGDQAQAGNLPLQRRTPNKRSSTWPGRTMSQKVICLDLHASHMDPSVAELIESRGHVLQLLAGGTTGCVQINDTHLHQPSRKEYERL